MVNAPEPPPFTSPHCVLHQRAAVATCVRCGTFLCGECTEVLGESAYCASCVAFLQKNGAPSRALHVTLFLELAALASVPLVRLMYEGMQSERSNLFGLLMLLRYLPVPNVAAAVLGFVLGARELRRGELLATTRSRAGWARMLAWLNLGFFLFPIALLLWEAFVQGR